MYKIFDVINLEMLGLKLEEEYYKKEIEILIKHYGLEIKQTVNNLYIPLPYNLLLNGFCPFFGGGKNIKFMFKFNNSNPIVKQFKKIRLNLELLVGKVNLEHWVF